jgi:hypothetical protein
MQHSEGAPIPGLATAWWLRLNGPMKKSLVLMGLVALLFIVPSVIYLSADSDVPEPEIENAVAQQPPEQGADEPMPIAASAPELEMESAKDSDVVVQVGDIAITRAQLSDIQYGRDDQSRMEVLIQRAFLLLEFDRRGAELPEEVVQNRVNEIVRNEFHGNRVAFLENLKGQGYSEEQFRELEADNIRVSAVRSLLWREADVNDRSMREREEAIRKWVKEMEQQIPVVYANASAE